MGTKQYKITLTDEVATLLKAEDVGRGRLSEGIARFVHRHAPANTPTAAPKVDGRHRVRLDREAREKTVAEQKAYDAPRSEFAHRLEHAFIQRSPQRVVDEAHAMFEGIIPLEERMAIAAAAETNPTNLAERARADSYREAERVRRALPPVHPVEKPKPPLQTLRLSTKALRGSNLFGTPEFMTDAQIQETNDYWETLPTHPEPEIVLDSKVL